MTQQLETYRQTALIPFGHYGYTHYRIEEEMTPMGVVRQRHSWLREDGDLEVEDWILTTRRELSVRAA